MKQLRLALLALVMTFGSGTTMAACLNVHLEPWAASGWSFSPNSYCIKGQTSAVETYTVETGATIDFSATITLNADGQSNPAAQAGLVFRSSGSYTNGYLATIHHMPGVAGYVELFKNGVLVQQVSATINLATAYTLQVLARGTSIQVSLNGTPTISITDATYASGHGGLFRAGTSADFTNIFLHSLTLHSSEIGYQTFAPKRALLQTDAGSYSLPAGTSFQVRRQSDNAVVASGTPGAKQSKWDRDFWTLDFSTLAAAGSYYVVVSASGDTLLTSSVFTVGDTPLLDAQMYQIAVNQLEERYPVPSGPITGGYLPAGRNDCTDVVYGNRPNSAGQVACPPTNYFPVNQQPQGGDFVPKIWRDCSSNFAETESAGTTTLALFDLYEKNLAGTSRFNSTQLTALMLNAQRGADYMRSLQESHPGDPLLDGRLRHSTAINLGDQAFWAGNVHTWNDTVFGALVLARASFALDDMAQAVSDQTFKASLQASATAALTAAKKAWANADYRPYYLANDVTTAGIPHYVSSIGQWPWNDWEALARAMYGVTDQNWSMGTTLQETSGYAGLRSRELITFLNASMMLYRYTDETGVARTKYLTAAKAVAAELAGRQYISVATPVAGVSGMFHEFSPDSGAPAGAFLMESAQAGMTHQGNYQFTSLQGFIDLLTLAPTDPDAAEWYRVVQLWAEKFQQAAANSNPLGIAPNTVYASTQGSNGPAAISWFGNHLHGGNEIPGQAAHSLLEVGNYLNDVSYYPLAVNNVQFYAGVNPGYGSDRAPSTLIKNVGAKALTAIYMEPSAPDGSVGNGYSSTPAFSQSFYSTYDTNETIPPDGLSDGATTGQESWIMHSHAYVMGVAAVEAPFVLNVETRSHGSALSGIQVSVEYPSTSLATQTFTTGGNGTVTITSAHLGQNAVVRLTRSGYLDYVIPLATVGGGSYSWLVDYQDYVGIGVSGLPAIASANTTYYVTLTVEDYGDQSDAVTANFAYAGLSSNYADANFGPNPNYNNATNTGRQRTFSFNVTTGSANQSYVWRTVVQSGANVQIINSAGILQ